MVQIHPFCAMRYNPEVVAYLSDVLAPPYDLIDANEQERLYQASPYNIVRLILGKEESTDTVTHNRYTRARCDFDAWCMNGVLRQDPIPAFYLIEHAFSDGTRCQTRLGFTALLDLNDDIERAVYRHEATLDQPKRDRSQLLEAVPANLSPILCVYPDHGGGVQVMLREVTAKTPPITEATMNGEAIRLWAISDQHLIGELTRCLANVSVLIADGHHRFEVAYAKRARYKTLMCHFVSMDEAALILHPIHRIVHKRAAGDDRKALGALGVIESAADLSSLTRWLNAQKGPGRFGYYDGEHFHMVKVKTERMGRWLVESNQPQPLASLDVSVLHGLIMPHIGYDGCAVQYVVDPAQAVTTVDEGRDKAAWFLRGISLTQLYTLAAQGLVLPPKSTYFYPKVLSGLTVSPLDGG